MADWEATAAWALPAGALSLVALAVFALRITARILDCVQHKRTARVLQSGTGKSHACDERGMK